MGLAGARLRPRRRDPLVSYAGIGRRLLNELSWPN